MGSRDNAQLVFWFSCLILLVLVNGFVFSQMTIHVQEAQRQSSDFQKQIDEANTAMNDMKLNQKTQEEVRFYLLTTMGTKYEQEKLQQFHNEISDSLREKLNIEIFRETIKDNVYITTAISKAAKKRTQEAGVAYRHDKERIAKTKDDLMMLIVKMMQAEFQTPDTVLIEKNTEGTGLIFVQKGECMFTLKDTNMLKLKQTDEKKKSLCSFKKEDTDMTKEQTLRAGRYFGEISLTYGCKTTSNVLAKKYCTIGRLVKDDFNEIIKQVPQIAHEIKKGIYKYNDANVIFMKRAISKVPYFQFLQPEDAFLYDVIYSFATEKKQKGEILQEKD